jgi:hypothetical protein
LVEIADILWACRAVAAVRSGSVFPAREFVVNGSVHAKVVPQDVS